MLAIIWHKVEKMAFFPVVSGPPSLSQLQSSRQSHSQTRSDGNTVATTLRGDARLSSSSSSYQPEPQSPAAPPKPVGGFGTIMCVCCGASDHKTPNCPQRKNFFFWHWTFNQIHFSLDPLWLLLSNLCANHYNWFWCFRSLISLTDYPTVYRLFCAFIDFFVR